jgi:hypothetical protein
MKNNLKILSMVAVLAIVLTGTVAFNGTTAATEFSNQERAISVTGEGTVTAVPDIAIIDLGVEAEAKKVSEAQGMAAIAMNKIMRSLEKNGIAQKDIQTKHYYIYPVREGGEIIGYKVGNIAAVKIRDIDKVGIIIDDAVEAGGDLTRIGGISFGVDTLTSYHKEARRKAVNDAREKAEELAALNGVELGKPIHISEGGVSVPVYRGMEYAMATTPISPGELEISIGVSITYAIK